MSNFKAAIGDTHAYVGNVTSGNRDANATSYLYKGAGHMVGNSDWEPQRNNNFEVVIEGLDSLTFADGTTKSTNSFAERIMLSVDNFSAPNIEIAQITTHYANNSIKWAGKPEFPNSSIVINDYIGIRTETILQAWFRCAYDFKTEKIGKAINYKKTAYLIEYAPDGSEARTWRLDGCWLASFQLGDWNQQGNEQRKLNATLVYDRVIPDYGIVKADDPLFTSSHSEQSGAKTSANVGAVNTIVRDSHMWVTAGTAQLDDETSADKE